MTNRIPLTFARNLLLAAVGFGIVGAPQIRAQSDLKFEVATIKPSDPTAHNSHIRRVPGEGLDVGNITLKSLLSFAYDVRAFQISSGPGWIESERFDIVAKPERFEGPQDPRQMTDEQQRTSLARMRQRVQALLAERFQLAVHRENKDGPIYALVLAKGGSKLQPTEASAGNMNMSTGRGRMTAAGSTMEMLANTLSNLTGRTVRDRTGLTGKFDFKMEWTPDQGPVLPPGERPEGANPPDLSGASLFTAIQEQLGLKLESTRGPVEMIVVDRVEKPSAN